MPVSWQAPQGPQVAQVGRMAFARARRRSKRKSERRKGSKERSMEDQTWAEGLLTLGKAPERDTEEAQTSLVGEENWE